MLVNIGYGNMVMSSKVVVILSPVQVETLTQRFFGGDAA